MLMVVLTVFSLQGSTSKVSDKSEVEIIRYQVLIPVSEVQVRQIGDPKVPDVDTLGSNYSWELVHLRNQAARRSEKVYLLSNSTGEFRNAFLRNIRQIIRESVRNMSLPPRLSDMTGGDDDLDDDDLEDREPMMMPMGSGSGTEGGDVVSVRPGDMGSSSSHYATPEGVDLPDRPTTSSSSTNASAHHRGAHQAQTLGTSTTTITSSTPTTTNTTTTSTSTTATTLSSSQSSQSYSVLI